MKKPEYPALASIHDLMPETLDRVERIIEKFQDRRILPAALLVVPGKPWKDRELDKIHQWVGQGFTLIAHGWHHWGPPQSFRHHLHSLIISRQEAEHLSKSKEEVMAIMQRSHDWFVHQGFPEPEVYIPPTWALGCLEPSDLKSLPYRCIETLFGYWKVPAEDSELPEFVRLPVTGFLADTLDRAVFSRIWNRIHVRKARRQNVPLRISIHPDDFELRIADQLENILSGDWNWWDYSDLWRRQSN
jgi:predicted deacetylase